MILSLSWNRISNMIESLDFQIDVKRGKNKPILRQSSSIIITNKLSDMDSGPIYTPLVEATYYMGDDGEVYDTAAAKNMADSAYYIDIFQVYADKRP